MSVEGRLAAVGSAVTSRRIRVVAATAVGLVALGSAAGEAVAQEAAGVPLARHHGYPAATAEALASAGVGELLERSEATIRLRVAGAEVVSLRPGSPFLRHGDRILQMANSPYRRDGRTWIPAEFFVRTLPAASDAAPLRIRDGRLVRGVSASGEPGPFVVVIDAGHGGRDPGTRGPRGTDEKGVTLAIARELRDRLEAVEGIHPVMTRDRDTLIALRDRSRMAMAALNRTYGGREPSGGLFVSLHANAVARGNARGFETYFLGRATSEQAREVAMRENSAIQYEEEGATPPPDDVRFMLADLDKTQWIIESNRFAGLTQNALRQRLSGPDRGVKQANYLVLVWASGSMPSVLVEAGFLSDRREERMLASEAGQARVAEALADAVRDYQRRYERQMAATAARE